MTPIALHANRLLEIGTECESIFIASLQPNYYSIIDSSFNQSTAIRRNKSKSGRMLVTKLVSFSEYYVKNIPKK